MAHITDLVEDATLVISAEGIVATRIYQVENITGDAVAKTYNATLSGIPQRGEHHPVIPDIQLDTVAVKPNGVAMARLTLTYRLLDPSEEIPDDSAQALISVGGTTQFVRTTQDFAGNDITVEHIFIDTDSAGKQTVDQRTQVVEVDVQRSLVTYQFSRREEDAPDTKSGTYRDKINRTTFLGEPPKTMFCSRLDGQSTDGGKSYNVNYEFIRKSDTWDAVVTFIDDDGRPPQDLIEGAGRRTIQVYQQADFNALNLSL